MKAYFVEAYNPEITIEKDAVVIALTPEACFCLGRAGIAYSTPEKSYETDELLSHEKRTYFASQIKWFEDFNSLLTTYFPRADKIGIATRYHYFLKCLLDSVIVCSRILDGCIRDISPTSITYIGNKVEPDNIDSTLLFTNPYLDSGKESLFSRIAPLLAKEKSIAFERIVLEKQGLLYHKNSVPTPGAGRIIKNFLKRNKQLVIFIKDLKMFIKDLKMGWKMGLSLNLYIPPYKQGKLNLFLLKFASRHGIEELSAEFLKVGNRVFLKYGKEIFNYSKLGIKKYRIPNAVESMGKYVSTIGMTEEKIKKHSYLLAWINEQAGLDVSTIVLPRLKYFVEHICPELLVLIDYFVEFYNTKHINFVITPAQWETDEFAAITAARLSRNTKSVCIHHGNDTFEAPARDFIDLLPYDIYLSPDNEYLEGLLKVKTEFKLRTEIFATVSYRLEKSLKIQHAKYATAQKTVIYVPTFFAENAFMLDLQKEPGYNDVWYYVWQKNLLEFFALQKEFLFIWKVLIPPDRRYDPVYDLIKTGNYRNIEYATTPFYEWISRADLVIHDFPSTALYETAVAKVPTMSLYNTRFFKVRENAKKIFGKSLQPFSDIRDGIEKIRYFLYDNPEDYLISLPLSKTPILEILEKNRKKSTD